MVFDKMCERAPREYSIEYITSQALDKCAILFSILYVSHFKSIRMQIVECSLGKKVNVRSAGVDNGISDVSMEIDHLD